MLTTTKSTIVCLISSFLCLAASRLTAKETGNPERRTVADLVRTLSGRLNVPYLSQVLTIFILLSESKERSIQTPFVLPENNKQRIKLTYS